MSERGWRVTAIAFCVVTFALALLISATAGFSRDEAWFLQVVHRVVNGDVLYHDVFYLATPLPVQLTAALAYVFGTGILVEKGVAALAFVGEIAWAWLIARELGVSRRYAWLVWLAVFVYAQHYPNPPYRAIGSALMLAAFWTLLVWLRLSVSQAQAERDRAHRWLAATGAAAGACFSAMPNHGLLTIGSAAIVVALHLKATAAPASRWFAAAALVGGSFVVVTGAALAQVLWLGDFHVFLDYVVLNKEPYLRAGGASYWAELIGLFTLDGGALSESFKWFYRGLHVLLIPLAVVSVLDHWRRAPAGRRLAALAVFLLVVDSVAGAYPRLNRFHLSYAAPAVVVALAYSADTWSRILPVRLTTVRLVVAVWLLVGLLSSMAAMGRVMSADHKWSTLPHFRGVLIGGGYEAETTSRAARLIAASGSDGPLLLTLDSGLYYLVTGLRNPTPFDQVHVMNFGTHGQEQVISAITEGRVRMVCLGSLGDALNPAQLERHVRNTMRLQEDLGVCTVYR